MKQIIKKSSEIPEEDLEKNCDLIKKNEMFNPTSSQQFMISGTDSNKSYHYGDYAKITFDKNGYIVHAKGFRTILWSNDPENIDSSLKGKHITEFLEILKKYKAYKNIYEEFYKIVSKDFDLALNGSNSIRTLELLKNDLEQRIGISYEEFEQLDFDKQQRLLKSTHENSKQKVFIKSLTRKIKNDKQ